MSALLDKILGNKISIASFYRMFIMLMVTLLICGSVHIYSTFSSYQTVISSNLLKSENKYIVNALKESLYGLSNSIILEAEDKELFLNPIKPKEDDEFGIVSIDYSKNNLRIPSNSFDLVYKRYGFLLGIYAYDSNLKPVCYSGLDTYQSIIENEDILNAISSINSRIQRNPNLIDKGELFVIDDNKIIKHSNSTGISLVYPVIKNQAIEGYIVSIVPYEIMPILVKNSSSKNVLIIKTSVKTQYEDMLLSDDNEYSYVQNTDLVFSMPGFRSSVPINVLTASIEDLTVKSFVKRIYISCLFVCIVTIFVFIFGMVLSSNSIKKICRIIKDFNINSDSYKRTRTHITDISHIDKLMYDLWEDNHNMLEHLNNQNMSLLNQGHMLLDLKLKLEDEKKHLEDEVKDKTKEISHQLELQSETLEIYKQIIIFAEFMDKKARNSTEIGQFLIELLTKKFKNLAPFGFRISTSDEDSFEFVHQDVKCDFRISRVTIDNNRRHYYLQFPSVKCRLLVFPFHSNIRSSNALFLQLEEGKEISAMHLNEITFIVNSMASHIDNSILRNRIELMAKYDELTGLKNRNCYEMNKQIIAEEFELNPFTNSYGVFAIDLNGLKQTNDNCGHKAGDWMIKTCAKVLQECVAGIDEVEVYRIGGDEFCIIIPNSTELIEQMVINRFNDAMAVKHICEGKEVNVLFSYGYAEGENANIDELMLKADQKLYVNKRDFYTNNRSVSRRRADDR